MAESTINNHAAFIWLVADLLRGDYKQSEYGKMILPLTVIRRLDCVFERTPRIGPGDLADELSGTFRVSPEAMRYRLENLGIVDPGTAS